MKQRRARQVIVGIVACGLGWRVTAEDRVARVTAAPTPFGASSWVSRGPTNLSGLVTSLVIDPDDPGRYLAGTPAGIWSSSDAGRSWEPVAATETINVSCLTRDPVHHDILYAGSGTTGIFKSVDRGRTWVQISTTIRAFSIAVSADASTVIAESAIFVQRSTDGGASWQRVALGGVINGQLRFHPSDPNRALAVFPILTSDLEDTDFRTAFFTTNGGVTWQPSSGLAGNLSGLTLEYYQGDPSIVLAFGIIQGAKVETLFRSDDGGASFHSTGAPPTYGDGMRIVSMLVAPNDPAFLLTGGIDLARSMDGGATFDRPQHYGATSVPHNDVHGMAADPHFDGVTNKRVLLWGDGGIYRTDDILVADPQWDSLSGGLTNTQSYVFDISADGRVIDGLQDTGFAVMDLPATNAQHPADGDVTAIAVDPTDPTQYFVIDFPSVSHVTRIVASGTNYLFADSGAGQQPSTGTFLIDPNDSTRMFAGSATILRLEGFLPSSAPHPQKSTVIRNYPAGASMSAIAVQKGDSNVVWTGRVDNAFSSEQRASIERTANALSASPEWKTMYLLPTALGMVMKIEIDPADSRVVYALALHGLLVTRDQGATWANATPSAPADWLSKGLFDFVRHPLRSSWWYVGGRSGLYGTVDAGSTWQPAPDFPGYLFTRHLQFAPGTETLWAAVWSRGLWSRDVSPGSARRRTVRPSGDLPLRDRPWSPPTRPNRPAGGSPAATAAR